MLSTSSSGECSSYTAGSRNGNESSTSEALSPPPRKKLCKKKYYHSYNKLWENEMEWLSSSSKGSKYGYCKSCDKHLLCAEGGVRDLKRHSATEGHKKMSKSHESQKSLQSAFANSRGTAAKSARAEVILANMLVEHNLPFLLMDHLPGVICHAFPDKSARTKTHRSFAGEGWVTYYRRKASFTKSLDWGQVDFNLYNETFTGRARSINRCRYCLSEHHSSVPPRLTGRSRYDATRFSTQPCHLYNNWAGNRCRFTPCRFAHTCTECRGSHPASQCRSRPPPPKLPWSESPGGKNRR